MLTLILMLARVTVAAPHEGDPLRYTDFLKSGYSLELTGVTPEAATQLIVRSKNGDEHAISSFGDLSKYVRIRTSDEAVQYVRIWTSPVTRNIFDSADEFPTEVLPFERLSEKELFGDRALVKQIRARWEQGLDGYTSQATLKRAGYVGATVSQSGANYTIARWVVREIRGKNRLFKVVETVNAEGRELRKRETLVVPPTPIPWHQLITIA